MSVTSINALTIFSARSNNIDSEQLPPIDVAVSAGEFSDVKELAARLVKLALGTTDLDKVQQFLEQSGFKLDQLPARLEENERTFYRFEPDANFLKSIESFKQTGKALSLGGQTESKTPTNDDEQIVARQNPANTTPASVAPVRPVVIPPRIQSPQIALDGPGAPSRSDFNPADWHKVELNPQDFAALTRGKNGKQAITVSVADKDPRQEMYQAAITKLYSGKFSEDVVSKLLENRTDANSVFYVGTHDAQSKEKVIKDLETTLKTGKPYDFYIHKGNTEQLMRSQVELHGTEADKLQLKIGDSLKAIDEKYAKMEVANPLHASVLALQKESEKKATIDALTAASNIDFRSNATDAERYANQTADLISTVTRTLIDANPLYSHLPEAAKDELVKGTLGFLRGGYSLYQTAKGVENFVNDGLTDGALSVLRSTGLDKQIGIDAEKVQTALNVRRQEEAQYVQAISNMGTAEMSRGDASLAFKQNAGLSIKPYDLPNWTAKGGELTAKALPYIALGVATGGVGPAVGGGARALLVETGITAAATGTMGTGENYSLTREHAAAIKAGGMAAAQGAAAPLTSRLGISGDLAANTVYTVALGKLEGKSDAEIFQDAVLQNTLSLSMQAGSTAHQAVSAKLGKTEFTTAEAQTALKQIFREEVGAQAARQAETAVKQIEVETVAEHLSKGGTLTSVREAASGKLGELHNAASSLKNKLATAKEEILADYGKNNRIVTREQMQAARENIARYWRESFNQTNIGADPSVLAQYAKLATGHVEAGVRSLEQFATAMRGEAAAQKKTLTDAELQKLYEEAADKHLTEVKTKLSPEAAIEFDKQRAQHGDTEFLQKLPSSEANTLKKFEGIVANRIAQSQKQIKLQENEQAARTLLNRPEFTNSNELKSALGKKDDLISSVISEAAVEVRKQNLLNEYQPSEGYKILSGVLMYEETGFKTMSDWKAANPGKPSGEYTILNGRVVKQVTDVDLLVLKKSADGQSSEIIQLEQVKSGSDDRAVKAQQQMDKSVSSINDSLQGGPKVVLVSNGVEIAGQINLKTINTAKQMTVGLEGKEGFGASLGLSHTQLRNLAKEIIANHSK